MTSVAAEAVLEELSSWIAASQLTTVEPLSMGAGLCLLCFQFASLSEVERESVRSSILHNTLLSVGERSLLQMMLNHAISFEQAEVEVEGCWQGVCRWWKQLWSIRWSASHTE